MTNKVPPATLYWVGMSLEGVHIIEVSLPVLDKTSVVRGYHPHTIMTPHHATDWAIMTLIKHTIT